MNINSEDNEPWYVCKNCGSSHIIEDDGNDICKGCGAVNYVRKTTLKNYLNEKEDLSL